MECNIYSFIVLNEQINAFLPAANAITHTVTRYCCTYSTTIEIDCFVYVMFYFSTLFFVHRYIFKHSRDGDKGRKYMNQTGYFDKHFMGSLNEINC